MICGKFSKNFPLKPKKLTVSTCVPHRKTFQKHAQRYDEQNSANQTPDRDDYNQDFQPWKLQIFTCYAKIPNLKCSPIGLIARDIVCDAPPNEGNPKMRDQEKNEQNAVNAVVEFLCVSQDFDSFIPNDEDDNSGADIKAECVDRRFGFPRKRHSTGTCSLNRHNCQSTEKHEKKLVVSVKLFYFKALLLKLL